MFRFTNLWFNSLEGTLPIDMIWFMSFKQIGATNIWFLYYVFKTSNKNQTWKGILKKNKTRIISKGPPPKKTNLLFQMGGLTAVCHFFGRNQPWSLFVSPRRASSCAAGCHAPAEEGERAVPHEAGIPVAALSGGETIWMGSDLMNRMNVMILAN